MQKQVIFVGDKQLATILAALDLYKHEGLGDQDADKSIQTEKGIDELVEHLQSPSHEHRSTILSTMKEDGMLFGECLHAFSVGNDDPFVRAASASRNDDLNIDSAITSVGNEGAWVMAWVWVSNEEAGVCQTVPCVKVEYDTTYTGGDYNGVGSFVYIPEELIEASLAELSMIGPHDYEDALHLAFRKQTHLDSMHIVHYTSDEAYTPDGELIEQ